MRKKYAPEHVMIRDGDYYYVRHIPCDLASIYSVTRLCFSLKTKSLKAAIRTSKSVTQRLESNPESDFMFPRYANVHSCNANSASAAINKWLKPRVPDNCVIHSFRHSMRDRLRAVECPSDIIDAIGGWTTTGVGQRYGTGQPLEVKAKWMDRLVDQD
jgi:integrase